MLLAGPHLGRVENSKALSNRSLAKNMGGANQAADPAGEPSQSGNEHEPYALDRRQNRTEIACRDCSSTA